MKRLVVVAGPQASGKSSTIRALLTGRLPWLGAALDMDKAARWGVILPGERHMIRASHYDGVLLHYDLLRQWSRGRGNEYDADVALAILDKADDVTFVTLWTRPDVLIRRLHTRRAALQRGSLNPLRLRATLRRPRRLRKLSLVETMYYNPSELKALYDRWALFCNSHEGRAQIIIDTSEEESILRPAIEWTEPAVADSKALGGGCS